MGKNTYRGIVFLEDLFYIKLHRREKEMFHFEQITEILITLI